MPQPAKGPRLGSGPAHEKLMLANLATSLFKHGRITTTVAKARRLRPYAEHLITRARRGDLHSFRRVLRVIPELDVAYKLRDEIAPQYANRPGGYTRIIKAGVRKGDAAPLAIVELVTESMPVAGAAPAAKTAKAAARRSARAEAVQALAGETEPATPARMAVEPGSTDANTIEGEALAVDTTSVDADGTETDRPAGQRKDDGS